MQNIDICELEVSLRELAAYFGDTNILKEICIGNNELTLTEMYNALNDIKNRLKFELDRCKIYREHDKIDVATRKLSDRQVYAAHEAMQFAITGNYREAVSRLIDAMDDYGSNLVCKTLDEIEQMGLHEKRVTLLEAQLVYDTAHVIETCLRVRFPQILDRGKR